MNATTEDLATGISVGSTSSPASAPPVPHELSSQATVDRAVEAVRRLLGMEIAFVAETRRGMHEIREIAGDVASLPEGAGAPKPLEDTHCSAMLDGDVPNAVPDLSVEPLLRDKPVTEALGIGAYVGVPITLPDGSVYGTFCCVSRSPTESPGDRQVEVMRTLAELIGLQVQREDALSESHRRAATAGSVAALIAAVEARDGYTGEHSHEVVELSAAVGREMGLPDDEIDELKMVALLHDVGKIGIADAVLHKPGELDAAETAEMRRHPEIGERIVASMPGLEAIAPAIRAEHERWDGGGYPDGLSGTRIPLASRIVLVCDAYHAMTSERPYRKPMPKGAALAELRRHSGSQFCPASVHAALSVLAPGAIRDTSPDAATLVGSARAREDLARDLELRAAGQESRGKHGSAAVTRRKAAEHRDAAREARSRAAAVRLGPGGLSAARGG